MASTALPLGRLVRRGGTDTTEHQRRRTQLQAKYKKKEVKRDRVQKEWAASDKI